MYITADGRPDKVRKSIPTSCGSIKRQSNESKILIATAYATALNLQKLRESNGLVVRESSGRTPFPGLQTALIQTRGEGLTIKGTTGWLVYISSDEQFYAVKGGYKANKLSEEQSSLVRSCIAEIPH